MSGVRRFPLKPRCKLHTLAWKSHAVLSECYRLPDKSDQRDRNLLAHDLSEAGVSAGHACSE
jgi:hypothetical protein